MATVPTLTEVRDWTGVSAASVSDAMLTSVLGAEVEIQAAVCAVDPYTDSLHQAVLRRCGRELAARGVPLGITGDAELGHASLPTWDAEVDRLERIHRLAVVG